MSGVIGDFAVENVDFSRPHAPRLAHRRIADENGQRLFLVFGGSADQWWLRLLAPGFRHCFAAIADSDGWTILEPLSGRLLVQRLPLAAEFDLLGTRDPSTYLAFPAALEMMDELGRDVVAAYNHRLAWDGAHHLAQQWGVAFATPEEMIGTMANVRLPASAGSTQDDADRMRASLWDDEVIEVPVFAHHGGLTLRISAQIYNDMEDVDRLAAAVLARS